MANNNQKIVEYKPTKYGLVGNRELTEEMKQSYLDYAMSVIISRALPDVRDGLKPVHRRILYAMWELGLKSKAKYRKSATVVGEVLGKYHPHGDMAVYESLVRMAQDFAMRAPLVKGQGNFGSMDGDSAAAMRYTEAKMEAIAEELLYDINKNTVDFLDNYDATRKEPVVLPGKFPNLLVNGALGIAVGMATNIPPHNLSEIIDGCKALIDNPDLSNEKLLELIPGPDFPTGGHIYGHNPIKQAYNTGKGSIVMRAVASLQQQGKRRQKIIISELPYQVNKAELISKIANLVKTKRIEGIADIRDESDRKEGVRIVIVLKGNAYPKKVLNQLYKLTPMQTSFYVNMVALVDGLQPRLLQLREIILEFIKHRRKVVTRRVKFKLKQAQAREHILQGLKKALDEIDAIITTIRESKDAKIAKLNLIKVFKLTPPQAEAILEMRLSALAGLERKQVLDELAEKIALIKKLTSILADPKKIDAKIKKELDEIKQKYPSPRRTKIFKREIGDFSLEDLVPNEYVIITLTKDDYIKRQLTQTYRAQLRGGKGIIGMTTKDEDQVEYMTAANTHDNIFFFTNAGRVFKAKVYDLPESTRQAKGKPLAGLIQLGPEEKVTSVVTIAHNKKSELKGYLLMSTDGGTIKKTPVEKYINIRSSGIIAIRLKDKDKLSFVKLTSGKDNIMVTTLQGQGIYFRESDVRPMGRSAAGVRGIKLRPGDKVIAMDIVRPENNPDLLTVLENGYGKRTIIEKHFHLQRRGGYGLRVTRTNAKTGLLVTAKTVSETRGDLVIVSRKGQVIRIKLSSAKRLGRNTMGVRLMKLKAGDKIASVALVQNQKKIIAELEGNQESEINVSDAKKLAQKRRKPTRRPKDALPRSKHAKTARKASKPKPKQTPNYWGGK